MNDLITIVLPIYNGEKYLRESIESIINQTHKNLEIFLIDDGSNDNSLSIAKYYEKIDKRIKVFTQNNVGICMSFRKAVMFSNAEYIARCDSDDINELDRYEKQLKYLKENDYDMVGCYYKGFGNGSNYKKRGIEVSMNIPIRNYFSQYKRCSDGGAIYGGSIFSKTSVLKKFNPFHKDYSGIEDVYLYTILHKSGCKIGILEEVLYNYRVHMENTSMVPTNRKVFVPYYFDVLFGTFHRELIDCYKNIIIIKRKEEEELIRRSFQKYFGNLSPKFVNEDNFEKFIQNEILNYNSQDSLFFISGIFLNSVVSILINRNFEMYKNIFIVTDMYL